MLRTANTQSDATQTNTNLANSLFLGTTCKAEETSTTNRLYLSKHKAGKILDSDIIYRRLALNDRTREEQKYLQQTHTISTASYARSYYTTPP